MSEGRFQRKPILVEAIQWTGENAEGVEGFIGDAPHEIVGRTVRLWGATAAVGCWLTKSEGGHFDSHTSAAFAALYETAPTKETYTREQYREAIYRELTGRTGLPDHELVAALDRADAAIDKGKGGEDG